MIHDRSLGLTRELLIGHGGENDLSKLQLVIARSTWALCLVLIAGVLLGRTLGSQKCAGAW